MLTFLLIIEDHETRNKLEQLYIMYQKEMYYMAYDIFKMYMTLKYFHEFDDKEIAKMSDVLIKGEKGI